MLNDINIGFTMLIYMDFESNIILDMKISLLNEKLNKLICFVFE